jgi:hypothetical protein
MLLASDFDKSKYFKADDFSEKEKRLKIKEATEEFVGPDKERKLVVWFTNDERGLLLNRLNNRTLRGAFGDDCAGWVGKVITIFLTETEFKGKIVPALRVRIAPPKQATVGNGQAKPQPAASPQETLDEEPTARPAPTLAEEMNDSADF